MDPIAKSKLTSRAAEPVLAKSSPILWDIEPSFPSLGCNSDLASKTFLENGSSLGYGPAVYSSEGYSQRVLFTGIYDHHHITAPIGTGRMQQGRQSSPSPLSTPSLLPLKEESTYVGHVGGALFDSLSREFSRINLEPGADSPKQYLVVKLSNVSTMRIYVYNFVVTNYLPDTVDGVNGRDRRAPMSNLASRKGWARSKHTCELWKTFRIIPSINVRYCSDPNW